MDDLGFQDEWTLYVETPPSSLSNSYVSPGNIHCQGLPVLGIPKYKAPPNPVAPPQAIRPEGDETPPEIESRVVEIPNAPKCFTEENIAEIIDPPTIIDYFEMQEKTLVIEFYDIRHAIAFKNLLAAHKIDVAYGIPRCLRDKPDAPVNLGTIVLLHLVPSVTNQQLQVIFSQFGEIRQIRGTRFKPTQRFIEYWDIRSSQKALEMMAGTILSGSKIVIEFSMPGGMRKRKFLE